MNPLYPETARQAEGRCEYCHAPQEAFNVSFEVEHIQPVSAGGTDSADNLALACRSCNAHKGARLGAQDPEDGTTVPLYHPRRQEWNTHFVIDAATLQINGKTATGRATAAALQLNSPLQRFARRQWARLDLFP